MYKRLVSIGLVFSILFTVIIGRCGYIALNKSYAVDDSYNSYKIDIGTLYTNIYDRMGCRLNNNTKQFLAVVFPNEKNLSELELIVDMNKIKEIKDELSKGYPIVLPIDKKVKTKYIKVFERIEENSPDMLCKNMIDKNYGGLENYTDKEIGSLSLNYSINARGELLTGDSCNVIDNNYDSREGVIISIDSNIQKIAEESTKSIPKGAVVIMDVETSQVLASVSSGDDYINRAISPYAVGSVFKIIITACALENNLDLIYNCTGKIKVGDTEFHCQNYKIHGYQNIKDALANSCNCYFVNLVQKLGKDKIYETAKKFGFGENYSLYNKWSIRSGYFPPKSTLESKGQLALIGFGQGMLTDSPMHFASAICTIANGGIYNKPSLNIKNTSTNRIMSKENTEKLKSYMKYVVTDGTGFNANYKNESAGKTATAQSGIYLNGKEVLNTWFAGFYPYNNPKYAIVVMQENGTSGAENCCPVFRTIVEKLDKM